MLIGIARVLGGFLTGVGVVAAAMGAGVVGDGIAATLSGDSSEQLPPDRLLAVTEVANRIDKAGRGSKRTSANSQSLSASAVNDAGPNVSSNNGSRGVRAGPTANATQRSEAFACRAGGWATHSARDNNEEVVS